MSSADEVIAGLRQYAAQRFAPAATRRVAENIGTNLAGNIVSAYETSGLGVRNGFLKDSLQYRVQDNADGTVVIEAGSYNVRYAAIHEFGFRGVVAIRAHARKAHTNRGRSIPASVVGAHSRNMNIPARPFVHPGFQKSKPRILEILREFYAVP